MLIISFKNVGIRMVTKNINITVGFAAATSAIVREHVSRMMDGRPFEILTIADNEFGVYYQGILAGSFTVKKL